MEKHKPPRARRPIIKRAQDREGGKELGHTGESRDGAPEVTGSVLDLGVNWSFQTNAPGADWIWETRRAEDPASVYAADHPLYDPNPSSNGRVVVFERAFSISGVPTGGTLRIAADNCYEVWINGEYVARSATAKVAEWEKSNLTEGLVGSSGWQTVGSHTGLQTCLKSGENTIRILAGNEYYHPTNASFEFNNSPAPPYVASPYRQQNPGALIFTLGLEYKTLSIEASKWYDRDKDGVWDEDEPGLEGWKLNLSKGDDSWCDLTECPALLSSEYEKISFASHNSHRLGRFGCMILASWV